MKKTNSVLKEAMYRIGYQCFVDSFAISQESIEDKAERYQGNVYTAQSKLLSWNSESEDYCYGNRFYGGDLNGLTNAAQKYLAELGVNLLYMTPVFKALTNHKYDTVDYKLIDPQFGTLADFEKLIQTCHQNDIKLILDGVFNHTSSEHEWYQKARQGIEPFTDYYK